MMIGGIVFGILLYGVVCRIGDMVDAAKHAGFKW